jgi:hypothetical protein
MATTLIKLIPFKENAATFLNLKSCQNHLLFFKRAKQVTTVLAVVVISVGGWIGVAYRIADVTC